MDPTSGSRLGHCGCGAPARYTCPLCAAKTCSVTCAKAHKLNTPCTGIAKKVHEKGLKANEWNWGNLMRDQSYLSGLGRVVDGAGRALVGGGLIPSANSTLSASGATDFSSGSAAAVGRLDELSEKESRIRREAGKSEGVRLVILPKGMTRRGKNATKWDQTAKCLDWTTEFTVPSTTPGKTTSLMTVPQPSSTKLSAILSLVIAIRDKKGKGKPLPAAVVDGVTVPVVEPLSQEREWLASLEQAEPSSPPSYVLLLAVVTLPPTLSPPSDGDDSTSRPAPPPPSHNPISKLYYAVDLTATLRETLARVTLLEFPSFVLLPHDELETEKRHGRITVVARPTSDVVVEVDKREAARERRDSGRGGRGRGQGRGGGRGGRGGGESGARDARDDAGGDERVPDSGWGKRGGAPSSSVDSPGEKRIKLAEPSS